MSTKSVINKRKVGGFGLSSSIVRSNIDDEGYIKYIIGVINLRLFDNKDMLTYRIGTAGFQIIYNNWDSIIIRDLDFVKYCRSISITEFERVIIQRLLDIGYDFCKDNKYFKEIMK